MEFDNFAAKIDLMEAVKMTLKKKKKKTSVAHMHAEKDREVIETALNRGYEIGKTKTAHPLSFDGKKIQKETIVHLRIRVQTVVDLNGFSLKESGFSFK